MSNKHQSFGLYITACYIIPAQALSSDKRPIITPFYGLWNTGDL